MRFQPGDRVKYVGERFRKTLNGEHGPSIGEVHSRVAGKPNSVVVDFPRKEGTDSFILSEDLLVPIA
jgi:hypothetical protein